MEKWYIPSDSNSKSTFRPVSSLDYRHLAAHVATWSVEDLVGVSVVCCGVVVRVGVRPFVFMGM
jgi:hypothetical protein